MLPPLMSCLAAVLLLQQPTAAQPPQSPENTGVSALPPISDNSFLIEEAYNQEYGVVQHASMFVRNPRSGAWSYSFAQEWPLNPSARHQLSYSVAAASGPSGTGVGDTWINWRFQARNGSRTAIAPRFSVSLPTGDAQAGRGAGGTGLQFGLPVSIRTKHTAWHSNAAVTVFRHATNDVGEPTGILGLQLGQSAVWLARPRLNVLCEVVFIRQQTTAAVKEWATDLILNPGLRWSHNFASGLQIVPGVSIPIDLRTSEASRWSVLAYLSVEHHFGTQP
jgi:hypothetical protein